MPIQQKTGEMGCWLAGQKKGIDGIVLAAWEEGVPIFCPAFSDYSARFGSPDHHSKREAI